MEKLEALLMLMELEMEESRIVLDEELGFVFYPCPNAIEEGLNRSMAWKNWVI